jgi:hypothetical protein
MTLTSGRFIGHEYDRMIVRFSMHDGAKEIPCAITTSAMDYLERGPQVRPKQREAQFIRLRDRIQASTAIRYRATEFEGTPPGIVLRGFDLRPRQGCNKAHLCMRAALTPKGSLVGFQQFDGASDHRQAKGVHPR